MLKLAILGTAVIVAMGGTGFAYEMYMHSQCPRSGDTREELQSFQKWVTTYLKRNPDASMEEAVAIRMDFYRSHGCTHSLDLIHDLRVTMDSAE